MLMIINILFQYSKNIGTRYSNESIKRNSMHVLHVAKCKTERFTEIILQAQVHFGTFCQLSTLLVQFLLAYNSETVRSR